MDAGDVLGEVTAFRDRIAPFLDPGEHVQSVLRASSRPARAIKLAAMEVWPFFAERARFLLVATDRRWLVLESEREELQGWVQVRAVCDRAIRIQTSWLTRFDRFDQPYSIDPLHELNAEAANDALDAMEEGRAWSLEEAAARLGAAARVDPITGAISEVAHGVANEVAHNVAHVATTVGRFVPRRRGHGE